ncbi:HNH endonuclease, partial [Salmonella enterica subsp. enterica serovar Typhimurium]|nr:HNH endonuclease [Salmonella enterica subsp. enterica serovar Typhimurium]
MALTRKQRERLRMKFGGRCAYCGCELPEKGWHADHVQAVLRKSERCMKAAEKGIFRLKS